MKTVLIPDVRSKEGHVVVRLGIDLVLYLDTPLSEIPGVVKDLHKQFVSRYSRSGIQWYLTNTMTGFEAVKPSTLKWLGHWLDTPAARKDRMGFILKGSETLFDAAAYSLEVRSVERNSRYFNKRASVLRIQYEPESIASGGEWLVTLVTKLGAGGALISGHAGYVLERSQYYEEQSYAESYALGMRYLAVDISDGRNAALAVRRGGVKCVNWLTLLGQDIAKAVGGAKGLSKTLGRAASVSTFDDSAIVVQLGERPILGDRHAKEDVSHYRALAGILKPMIERAVASYPPFTMGREDNNERTESWLRRLYG